MDIIEQKQEFLDKMRKCFQVLREQDKILARGNAGDCSTCASYNLWSEIEGKEDEWIGIVHWNEQSEERFMENYNELYIGYSTQKEDENSLKQLTDKLIQKLKENEIKTEWYGDFNSKILVIFEGE